MPPPIASGTADAVSRSLLDVAAFAFAWAALSLDTAGAGLLEIVGCEAVASRAENLPCEAADAPGPGALG